MVIKWFSVSFIFLTKSLVLVSRGDLALGRGDPALGHGDPPNPNTNIDCNCSEEQAAAGQALDARINI